MAKSTTKEQKPKTTQSRKNQSEERKIKKFTQHDFYSLSPKTYNQKQFIERFNEDVPVICNTGCPGTGKTFLALYMALREVFSDSMYDRVVLFRSAVECRRVGFLPGDEIEKKEIYEAPYENICNEIIKTYKSSNYKNMKETGKLEFNLTSYERGKTYDRSIMIVEECQNMSYQELKTLITRCGQYSKIIFCGDTGQDDLHFSKNDQSGLNKFLSVLQNMSETAIINFTTDDIVRSDVVRSFIIAEQDCGYL